MKAKMVDFQKTINKLFSLTGKRIEIEGSKFTVVTDYGTLPVEALSSGEMQILLILLRVFLLNGSEAVVMIDEPENSLDIEWQFELVNLLTHLNGKAQYFITTHSQPSLVKDGEIRFGTWRILRNKKILLAYSRASTLQIDLQYNTNKLLC